jgi:superfamily II DNA or RNA helicase/diadenosine tetraphosphate (Ap4A) HIT family hydrolase
MALRRVRGGRASGTDDCHEAPILYAPLGVMTLACPFCSPSSAVLIAEVPLARAMWDAYPVSPGHALITTTRHISSWFDATKAEQTAAAALLTMVRTEIDRLHQPTGYNIGLNEGADAGQTVEHAHLHVIPRYHGDVADPTGGVRHVIPGKGNYLTRQRSESSLVTGGTNDPLLTRLVYALGTATRVDILAAFVLQGGVNLIVQHLSDVLDRGGRVRILTGDYFEVTEPNALRRLLDLEGDLQLCVLEAGGQAFHPKAYLVSGDEGVGVAFVGSSNLSRSALLKGIEWNYRVIPSAAESGYAEIVAGFDELWGDSRTQAVDESWIKAYEERRKRDPERRAGTAEEVEAPPSPHELQVAALHALEETREAGNTAGLVVLATGLGKTWLSAFDTKRSEFKKVLFVAHREEILRQALNTFRRIRPTSTFGTYSGQAKDTGVEVLFASIQTLSRTQHLHRFDPHEFDYIVVDEFHHAAARSYRRVIGYFEPRFLLGLTATPERTDGADLLALCGDNLVYRADLADGIDKGRLAPFDYFGVPDLVDYDNIPWRSSRFDEEALTREVATRERAQNAVQQLAKYGSGRTLAFCVSQRHADFMADFFNHAGLRAVAVHSGSTSAPRTPSLEQLQAGELDIVCSVDMFNEGVDLPDLNTVLMLRPTESRVLWLQQFGRGLRFRPEKRLKVIDYIGNHRTFLTKTQALLGLGNAEREVAYALEQLGAGTWDLPPGCTVTYELEAKDILLKLIPTGSAGDRLEDYYREFKKVAGIRPLASQALFDGFNPRSTRRAGLGSWLEFVDLMGDLGPDETTVYKQLSSFLTQLEVTKMTKSYKMVVLLAMLGGEGLPGRISIEELVDRFQDLIRRYTPLREEVGDALDDPTSLARMIRENPINAWTGVASMGGRAYFDFDGETFSSHFTVAPHLQETAEDLIREVVEWRLFEYLRRGGLSRGPDQFVCTVSHSGGRPILFLPPRAGTPGIPEGWTDVIVDDDEFQANLVKIAINVVTVRGGTRNLLPEILRRWFGDDAGQPGRSDRVLLQIHDGAYLMSPLGADQALPEGPILWQRYLRRAAFTAAGTTPKGQEEQSGVVRRDGQMLLFVTLDKGGKAEEHRYADEFLSASEFQWQSQNRSPRDGTIGKALKHHEGDGVSIRLFVRAKSKVRNVTQPFLYAGELIFKRWEGDRPITVWWKLVSEVPADLWDELGIGGS